jgi:undecaprenyl-diphosphatase
MHQTVIVIAKYFVVVPVLALAFVFYKLDAKHRKELIIILGLSSLLAVLLVKLGTSLYQDPRPFVRDGVKPFFASSTDNGFPSDHAAFSMLLALIVTKYSRKLGIILVALSLLIGWSRVISGVHHAQDIVGGAVLAAAGFGLAILLLNLAKWVNSGHYTNHPKPN